jgi:hypothetical protein
LPQYFTKRPSAVKAPEGGENKKVLGTHTTCATDTTLFASVMHNVCESIVEVLAGKLHKSGF